MTVRLWSPLAVALYGLLLGFPSALVPAVRNWRALGMHKEATRYLLGALLLFVPLVALLLLLPDRAGRILMVVLNIVAFSLVKAKLRSDIADVQAANPELVIQYRGWYSAFGWALLGLLAFVFLAGMVAVVFALTGLPVPD